MGENELSSIDVSANTNLEVLVLDYNELTTIDLSNNLKLVHLNLNNNNLSKIDLINQTLLSVLRLNGMQFELEVGGVYNISDYFKSPEQFNITYEINNSSVAQINNNETISTLSVGATGLIIKKR